VKKTPEEQRAARNAATARYRAKNPEKAAAMQLSWRKRNPTYHKQWAAKHFTKRARRARETKYNSVQRYPAPEHCEKCENRMADTPLGAQFDHDHATGFHRGWLCNGCNNGIARLGDTIAGLRQAIAYLERAEAAWQKSILS